MYKLELYVNGSGFRTNGTHFGVSGFMMTYEERTITEGYSVVDGSPLRETELRAFLRGLMNVYDFIDLYPADYAIDIYSNSLYGINCLTQWIYTWKKNKDDDGNYFSSSTPPTPIANQDLIDTAFDILTEIRMKHSVNFYHMNQKVQKMSLERSHKEFIKRNPFRKYMKLIEYDRIRTENKTLQNNLHNYFETYMKSN